jgi:hypothetical protein
MMSETYKFYNNGNSVKLPKFLIENTNFFVLLKRNLVSSTENMALFTISLLYNP